MKNVDTVSDAVVDEMLLEAVGSWSQGSLSEQEVKGIKKYLRKMSFGILVCGLTTKGLFIAAIDRCAMSRIFINWVIL